MKHFAVRLAALMLLLALLQVFVSTVFPVEIPQEALRIEQVLTDRVDIVYLGDSTISIAAAP